MNEFLKELLIGYKDSIGANIGLGEVVLRAIAWGLGFVCLDVIINIEHIKSLDVNELCGTFLIFCMIYIPFRLIIAKVLRSKVKD